ncbi:MAG TPA: dCTP deaminase [Terriglobia bacterium]|nr:dCTP deaminase [Terriglobia bacterium]
MILTDGQIRREIGAGHLVITPFEDRYLEPASYDLRVGKDAATIPQNGDSVRINLEEKRLLVIAPYAPAVIYAMEHIELPLNIAGHFGLKSGLSRRGIHASVGPQVDPGFVGKLSVTLFNLTTTPIALDYGETFLSLEFHQLEENASRGYTGEYQGRETFTSKDIEPVLGHKGGLAQVVKEFTELRDTLERIAALPQRFDDFLGKYERQNERAIEHDAKVMEFNERLLVEMKNLVGHIVGERTHTVVLRAITRQQAKAEILELFKNSNETLFYSDVAERLSLDLELVVELCNELENEGCIGMLKNP